VSDPISREPMGEGAEGFATPITFADLVAELVADAEEALQAAIEKRPRGPLLGIKSLDTILGDCLEPGIHSITGDPGSGKTALALQAAAGCQCPALFVTAEQSRKVLFQRHISRVTQTPRQELKRAVPKKVRELAEQAAAAAPMVTILDATQRPAPKEQIELLALALKQKFSARHVLLIVDAFQPWARGVYSDLQEYEATQTGIADLVAVNAALSCPVLLLSHRNRLAARDKNATGLVAAKGSADFEHLADTALHLSTDLKDRDPCSQEPIQVSCHVSKNRHGPSGFSLPLFFDGHIGAFSDRRPGPYW
jgi:replicative DNA helicase